MRIGAQELASLVERVTQSGLGAAAEPQLRQALNESAVFRLEVARRLRPADLPGALALIDDGSKKSELAEAAVAARRLSPEELALVLAALPAERSDGLRRAQLNFVSEHTGSALGAAARPVPRALTELLEREGLWGAVEQFRQIGRADSDPAELAKALARADRATLLALRELLVPRSSPLRAAHPRHELLNGPPDAQAVARLLGEGLGSARPSAAELHYLELILSILPPEVPAADRLGWAETLGQSKAAAQLVSRFGAGALTVLTHLGIAELEALAQGASGTVLLGLCGGQLERWQEAAALRQRLGRAGFEEALALLDRSGRADTPRAGDPGHPDKVEPGPALTVDGALAVEHLGFDRAIALFRLLEQDPPGAVAAVYLHGQDSGQVELMAAPRAHWEDSRGPKAQAIVALAAARGLDGLAEDLRRTRERIHSFGSTLSPLFPGANWPKGQGGEEVARREQALYAALGEVRRPGDLAQESRVAARMKEELRRADPHLAEQLERELQGRRFVSFERYDPLYAAGVANPEHRYGALPFAAWREAEAWVAERARQPGPLGAGWLAEALGAVHRRAGRGLVDTGQTDNMGERDLGRIRSTVRDRVALSHPVIVDRAGAQAIQQNPWLGRGTSVQPLGGDRYEAHIEFSAGQDVPRRLEELERWVRDHEGKLPPAELAAGFHARFCALHPVMDGSGRTAKLLTDLLLLRAGVEPPVFRQRHPIARPTTAATIEAGVRFSVDTIRRYWSTLAGGSG